MILHVIKSALMKRWSRKRIVSIRLSFFGLIFNSIHRRVSIVQCCNCSTYDVYLTLELVYLYYGNDVCHSR